MFFLEMLANIPYKTTALMERAASILDKLPMDTLRENGFYKNTFEYSYVFQYPPPTTLDSIEAEKIWSRTPPAIQMTKCRKIGLYIHIPYCTGTCTYCYFSRHSQYEAPVSESEYIELLKRELGLILANPHMEHNLITTIAFGGGTPTCFSNKQISDIFSFVRSSLNVENNIEISFESSPETISGKHKSKLETLLSLGVNRLSIGIQSFQDDLLSSLHRRHNAHMGKTAILEARESGFENINIDIIYGLPKQTLIHWENTLNIVTRLRPESISVYRLRVHPKGYLAQFNNKEFPDDMVNMLMYIMAVECFREAGYLQVASHNFVLAEAFIQKHVIEKQGIEEFELLGLGVSAYSYMNHNYYWNNCSILAYRDLVQAEQLPVWIGQELSIEEQMRKAMILGMHEYQGLNIPAFEKRFKRSPYELFGDTIKVLVDLELLSINGDSINPTYTGLIFADEICPYFYSKEVQKLIRSKGSHRYGISYIGDNDLQIIQ